MSLYDDPSLLVSPTYSIHRYTDQIYKIVKFRREFVKLNVRDTAEHEHYENKLDCSFSRSRRLLLEKALCNKWDWFCTFTIDPKKYDRFDLKTWYKSFSQFIRDYRKKQGFIHYLLVPEQHDDGAWHCHGFLSGDISVTSFDSLFESGVPIPLYLIHKGFYRWDDYADKFGFCSLGRIRSPVRSAFYITKYITKDNSRLVSQVGSKMFYCSQGLNTAIKDGDIYGQNSYLDSFLTADYQFCKVGMTKVSDNLRWCSFVEYYDIPFEGFEPLIDTSLSFEDAMVEYNYEQTKFDL